MHNSTLAPQENSLRHVTLTRLLAVSSLMGLIVLGLAW
jgi:uncharacterized membrane protein